MGDGTLVRALATSSFSADRDTFDPTLYPLQPLPFDRINENHPITSNFPVFRLPVELYSNIIVHLDFSDLANLALVDRDCRQLARSAQFSVVYLSLRIQSVNFLTHVWSELHPPDPIGELRSKIGPCVRRIVVATDSKQVHHFSGQEVLNARTMSRSHIHAIAELHKILMDLITHCLLGGFPNLELFQFADSVSIPAVLFKRLSKIPLRHLALASLSVEEGRYRYDKVVKATHYFANWSNIRTLHITFPSAQRDYYANGQAKDLFLDILHRASHSMESLTLVGVQDAEGKLVESPPDFQCLQRLHLQYYWKSPDDGSIVLSGLLPLRGHARNTLRALQLDRIDSTHLIRLGRLPSLTELVVNDYSLYCRSISFEFLSANSQLQLLSFTYPISPTTLHDTFFPIIHTAHFSSLRTLRLTVASRCVSRRVIAAIGLLPSLEMLWLSAGQQFGRQYDWFIDHRALKEGLKSLQGLRELAFSRESYHCERFRNFGDEEVRLAYYEYPVLPLGVSEDSFLTAEDKIQLNSLLAQMTESGFAFQMNYAWEKWHRRCMLDLATKYAALFPRLEFMYAGQYPMKISREDGGGSSRTCHVVVLSKARDSCLTLLNRKWGSQTT